MSSDLVDVAADAVNHQQQDDEVTEHDENDIQHAKDNSEEEKAQINANADLNQSPSEDLTSEQITADVTSEQVTEVTEHDPKSAFVENENDIQHTKVNSEEEEKAQSNETADSNQSQAGDLGADEETEPTENNPAADLQRTQVVTVVIMEKDFSNSSTDTYEYLRSFHNQITVDPCTEAQPNATADSNQPQAGDLGADEETEPTENNHAADLQRTQVVTVVINKDARASGTDDQNPGDTHDGDAEENAASQVPSSELEAKTAEDDQQDEAKRPCFARFIRHYRPILYGILVAITLALLTFLIVNNGVDDIDIVNTGTVIGLVCFDMIMCAILMILIGLPLIKAWTTKTWWLVFFLVYLGLIVDVFALSTYLTQKLVRIPLIIYGVVKVLLIVNSFCYARVDGKHFMPAIIAQYLTWKYIRRDTKMYKLIVLYMFCLLIQLVMFCIGSMAFILDEEDIGSMSVTDIVLFVSALVFFDVF